MTIDVPSTNIRLSKEGDQIIATGKDGLIEAIRLIQADVKAPNHIQFQHHNQKSVIIVDAKNDQFWLYDLEERASILEKNVIANILWDKFSTEANRNNELDKDYWKKSVFPLHFHQYVDIPSEKEKRIAATISGEVLDRAVHDYKDAEQKLVTAIAGNQWADKFQVQKAEPTKEPKKASKGGWLKFFRDKEELGTRQGVEAHVTTSRKNSRK